MSKDENDELIDELKRQVLSMNKRGIFARQTPEEKVIVETSTVEEWATAVKAEFGLHITNISPCQTDPPDCYANFEGRRISIELAELVDGNRLKESVAAIDAGKEPPHYQGQAFLNTQWSKDRFFDELSVLIDKKTVKYQRNKLVFDVLIIHTDETWLSPQQVRSWLAETDIGPRSTFQSAYLLMTYDPGYVDHWPVFRLFGSITPEV
jgi:hypothetical protein